MIKRTFAASLLCLGAVVSAQTILGKVTQVEGVVTISDGATVSTAVPGTAITGGLRFLTATSGAARLTMDNGCVISLKPNQSLTIGSNMSCRELLAAVQPVPSAPVVAGGTPGGVFTGSGGGALGVGGIMVAAGIANRAVGKSNETNATTGGQGGGIPVVPISGQ